MKFLKSLVLWDGANAKKEPMIDVANMTTNSSTIAKFFDKAEVLG